jgi:hypothetical protein
VGFLRRLRVLSFASIVTVSGVGLALVTSSVAPSVASAAPFGQVYAFGSAAALGSPGRINRPVVGMASTPSGNGYWVTAGDGGVFAFGDAGFHGSAGNIVLNKPVVGMTSTPTGNGYWFVATDGGIFAYGDAGFHGSTGDIVLNKPVVGMASTPTGNGYWLVASDGGIFAYGDAGFHGSTGNIVLNKPIVGMASTPTGNGYWLVASDGGIFAYGDAGFHGSTGDIVLNKPIVGMAPSMTGNGYWFTASDGGVFAYGDAHFQGSTGALALSGPVVGMARPTSRNDGYWLLDAANQVNDACIDDPAAEDPDTSGHGQIDITRTCVHAGSSGLTFDVSVRSPMTREQLLASLRNQSSDTQDSTFYGFGVYKGGTTELAGVASITAEGSDTFADVYREPTNDNEVPQHVLIPLAINGSTYTFGPIPYSAFLPTGGSYSYDVETELDHATGGGDFDVFTDDAPALDAGNPIGPVVSP